MMKLKFIKSFKMSCEIKAEKKILDHNFFV